jgi:hypothetical protein
MKKLIITIGLVLTTSVANAQTTKPNLDEMFKVVATIILFAMLAIVILKVIKYFMDYYLKNKIIDKEVPEHIAAYLLQTNPIERKNIAIKWFAILAGIGAGLMIIDYTKPLGIHSLAIMAFNVSASFLAYYTFLKQSEE